MARRALILANGAFADARITPLLSPVTDALRFCELLRRDDVGGYEVTICVDSDAATARRQVQSFFAHSDYVDLNVILISGHGIKDSAGKLHFATADTNLSWLNASAIEARFVLERMDESAAAKQILFIDTCYSGAFAKGVVATKSAAATITRDDFGNDDIVGKAIITASTSIQMAAEVLAEGTTQSIFTRHLIAGIETGQADSRRSGQIRLADLYEFIRVQLRRDAPGQTPQPFYYGLDGSTVLALNPMRNRLAGGREGPAQPEMPTRYDLGHVLQSRVRKDVLSLLLTRDAQPHLTDVGVFIEDFLAAKRTTNKFRYLASWIANELLANTFAYAPLAANDNVEVKIQLTSDGALISVVQPDDPCFDLGAILTNPDGIDSFMQLMAQRGLRWHAQRSDGRLDIGLLLPAAMVPAPNPNARPTRRYRFRFSSYTMDKSLVATVAGRIEGSAGTQFTDYMLELCQQAIDGGLSRVVIDLQKTQNIDSRGLRALSLTKRKCHEKNVEMILARPSEGVREILSISRYDKILRIFDRIEDAVC